MNGNEKKGVTKYPHSIDKWLKANVNVGNTELHRRFIKKWPEYSSITCAAFIHLRERRGAYNPRFKKNRPALPLYHETIKGGYVLIKIAEPNIYMSKNKWVWLETHPGESVAPNDVFIFLDGNNRNFAPDNIIKLTRSELVRYVHDGGNDPDKTVEQKKIILANVKLKILTFRALVKTGRATCMQSGSFYILNDEKNKERMRAYYAAHKDDPDYKHKQIVANKIYRQNMTPEKHAQMLARRRAKRREKQRAENEKNSDTGNI